MTMYLTPEEIAETLRVSKMTVYRVVRSGALPAVRIGRQLRVRQEDLEAYMAANLADYRQHHDTGPVDL